jgi:hypothetical protein
MSRVGILPLRHTRRVEVGTITSSAQSAIPNNGLERSGTLRVHSGGLTVRRITAAGALAGPAFGVSARPAWYPMSTHVHSDRRYRAGSQPARKRLPAA